MSVSVNGTNGVTFNDGSSQNTSAFTGGFGFRNRIINPAMVIDQRNAGASVTPANTYTVDRWQGVVSQTGKFSVQQNAGSVTPPAGFKNYLGVTSSSAYSVLTGDYFMLSQRIEGYNFVDFNFGTANAQSITFSFWVRSSLTGTFGGSLQGAASATLRSYPFTYTISAANTWEQKVINIAGDTFSNTWDSTNGVGLFVNFGLGAGSSASGTAGAWASANYANATGATSVVGTSGATFYITGVQLEKGSTATSFDYRPYGTELQLAQRYYAKMTATTGVYACFGNGMASSASNAAITVKFPTTMRIGPTANFSNLILGDTVAGWTVTSFGTNYPSSDTINLSVNASGAAMTTLRGANLLSNFTLASYIDFSSEL